MLPPLEFEATPPGRTTADKFMLGLLTAKTGSWGLIATDRGWPEGGSWWIALMLIDPRERGTASRTPLSGHSSSGSKPGRSTGELAVFDENKRADRFGASWVSSR
jgi:hypothetical protein